MNTQTTRTKQHKQIETETQIVNKYENKTGPNQAKPNKHAQADGQIHTQSNSHTNTDIQEHSTVRNIQRKTHR